LGKQVLAQSLFRSNDTNQAIERYFTMLQSSKDNNDNVSQEQMEILTNAMAVLTSNVTPVTQSTTSTSCQPPEDNYIITTAQALIDSTKNDHGNDDDELYPYDLAYNLGTHYVLTGQHCGIARALLQQAQVHATTINDKSTIQANLAWSTHWKTGNIVEEYPTKSTANAQVATVVQINTQKQPMQLDQNQLETFSPLQHRLYYYNRAISGIKSNKLDVCKESCQALLGTLGANNKKGLELPVAPTRFKDDEHWWKALVTVVEAHMLNHQGKKTEAIQLLDQRLVTLREHQKRQQQVTNNDILDHAITTILLHLCTIQEDKPNTVKANEQLQTLQQLPPSMQAKPGVVATMASLYQQLGQEDKAQELLNHDPSAFIHYYMSKGLYKEACELLEEKTDVISRVNYVQALLAMGQVTKATNIWNELKLDPTIMETTSSSNHDGQALEMAPLPKVKSFQQQQTMVLNNATTKTKKSPESILRQRAKRREQYLRKMTTQSTIVRPVDAERWIPKYERSGRKNRRHNNANKGSQGAGANERDAAKLDVAARKDGSNIHSGPSTANMVVAGSDSKRVGGGRKKR